MEDDKLISVNVWLGGRSYRIRIKPHEEEAVRKAVKLADEKIGELRTTYAGKDDQDFIAMCLLMYATNAATDTEHPFLQNSLQELTGKIDKALTSGD
jgi:cell division protein ZapA (FtsZ GTPase activity inhibitor)